MPTNNTTNLYPRDITDNRTRRSTSTSINKIKIREAAYAGPQNSSEEGIDVCTICLENFEGCLQVINPCGHIFHNSCYQKLAKSGLTKSCPNCRHTIENSYTLNIGNPQKKIQELELQFDKNETEKIEITKKLDYYRKVLDCNEKLLDCNEKLLEEQQERQYTLEEDIGFLQKMNMEYEQKSQEDQAKIYFYENKLGVSDQKSKHDFESQATLKKNRHRIRLTDKFQLADDGTPKTIRTETIITCGSNHNNNQLKSNIQKIKCDMLSLIFESQVEI